MKNLLFLLVTGMLLCGAPRLANAQDVFISQALTQLAYYEGAFNFYPRTSTWTGSLHDDHSEERTFTLRGGVTYSILGTCDDDCSDLDLRLYDEHYNLIDDDLRYDNYPVVSVTPLYSGYFHVEVKMADCSVSPCSYALGIYRE